MCAASDAAAIRAILLDIEGTTTPVTFVYDVLFPYARAQMRGFLQQQGQERGIRDDIENLRAEHARETQGPPPWKESAAAESAAIFALWLMDHDRKSTALKSLQGKIWEAGYRSGELRGEVYPDVPRALVRWRGQGRRIAIFSSGSVLAQKLLFAHSTAGDLTPHLEAYFDTTTGPKHEEASYGRIADALRLPPGAVLFLSDVTAELDAAGCAGCDTRLCVRPGAQPSDEAAHRIVHTFDEIFSQSCPQ